MKDRILRISLALLLCFGVFTTGVAEACWCQENCPCCKSQGFQYETEESVRPSYNRGCWTDGRIPCDLKKVPDMADSTTYDSWKNGPDRSADLTVILADYVFRNHPFACFARTPCVKATSKSLAIHLQNQALLF